MEISLPQTHLDWKLQSFCFWKQAMEWNSPSDEGIDRHAYKGCWWGSCLIHQDTQLGKAGFSPVTSVLIASSSPAPGAAPAMETQSPPMCKGAGLRVASAGTGAGAPTWGCRRWELGLEVPPGRVKPGAEGQGCARHTLVLPKSP